jgi:predicted ATPase/class 3 adenylate cyclase/DNA-binding winged helix-turn-helix (wHTH) protein
MVLVRLLGPIDVIDVAGVEHSVGSGLRRTLLALLALHAGQVLAADWLLEHAWAGEPPESGLGALRFHISRLRKELGNSVPIETKPGGYRLAVPLDQVDALAVERRAHEARDDTDRGRAAETFAEALDMWRRDPFVDATSCAVLDTEAVRLGELRLTISEDLFRCRLENGAGSELVADLSRLTTQHPLRESLWSALIIAQYRGGRQSDALRSYERMRAILADSLGLDPSNELQGLQGRVLQHDPSLLADAGMLSSDGRVPVPQRDAALPVTFLFTDIEGSTQLWESAPEIMSRALERHDHLLRQATVEGGGVVFKTVGDAFFAVFDSPLAAVATAVHAQQVLSAEPWPPEANIKVRMALHTGQCEQRESDFFGPTLNRVARLLAIGHGGQTLATRVVADLVGQQLPPSIVLVDMGEHRLRDLSRPQQVVEITYEGQRTFPPLRSLDNPSIRHNLPEQLSSFIGRDHELSELRDLVKDHRLVTVVGPGGVGKTRLALQASAEQIDRLRDGVWFIELAPLATGAETFDAIAIALGVVGDPARPLADAIVDWLRNRALLLVLDNCEHLLEDIAAFVDTMVRLCPFVFILATSREPLLTAGEYRYVVPPLSLPLPGSNVDDSEAIQLLVERAQQHQASFHVSSDNAEAATSLCMRLDGIPLALELAAARLATMSIEDLASRLSDRFRLLTGGPRSALPRQQTLRATVEWSYELLSSVERTILQRLTVFPGSWTLAAAESVVFGDNIAVDDIVEIHSSLVSKSLVQIEHGRRGVRFRLLEIIKAFAADELHRTAADEPASLRLRHTNLYVSLSPTIGAGIDDWDAAVVDTAYVELDNMRAALANALTLSDPEPALRLAIGIEACSPNLGADRRLVLQSLIDRMPDEPSHLLVDALWWLQTQTVQTNAKASLVQLDRALQLSVALNDHGRIASCLSQQSVLKILFDGDAATARQLGLDSLHHAQIEGHSLPTRRAHFALFTAYKELDDLSAAREHAQSYLTLAREAELWVATADGLLLLAELDIYEGELSRAQAKSTDALQIGHQRHYPIIEGHALGLLGAIELRLGRMAGALRQFQLALPLLRDAEYLAEVSGVLHGIACAARGLGDATSCAAFLGAGDSMLADLDMKPERPWAEIGQMARANAEAALGPSRFNEAYQGGLRLSRDDGLRAAIEYRNLQPQT